MTVESITKFVLDDTDFKRFVKSFDNYQKNLAKTTGMWQAAGKWQDVFGAKIAKTNTLFTSNARYQKMIEDSMRKQVVSSAQNERLWSSMASSSGTFAKNVASATSSLFKWGAALGAGLLGLGGVGLFGIDRMAAGVAGQRRSAQGLGMSIGQEKAFGINYGRLVDSGSYLGWINSMEGDISKQSSSFALRGRGLTGNTSNDAVSMLDSIRAMAKRTPLNQLGMMASAMGVDMSFDSLRRLKEGGDKEYGEIKAAYAKNASEVNIGDSTAKKWQDFTAQMQRAGAQIERIFVNGLAPLAGPLERLSGSLVTVFGKALEKNGVVEQGINTLAGWLDKWNGKISKPEFLKSVETFTSDIGDLAQAIHGLAHPLDTYWGAAKSTGTLLGRQMNDGFYKSDQLDQAAQANVFKLAAGYEKTFGIPKGLLQAETWLESRGDVNVKDSSKGAMGVLQFMPAMAKKMGFNPHDPGQSERAGGIFSQHLMQKYHSDIAKMLAAHNLGETKLDAAIAMANSAHRGSDWLHYTNDETRNYVSRGQVAFTVFNKTGNHIDVALNALMGAQ